MQQFTRHWLLVSEECPALLIPTAELTTLQAGYSVELWYLRASGAIVQSMGRLLRVNRGHVAKLGLVVPELAALTSVPPATVEQRYELIWQQLRQCYDPEIPVNIVDLGLIYSVECASETHIIVTMTLTAPGCGMGPLLVDDVEQSLLQIPGISRVEVKLTFEPLWSQERLSEAAKLELGMI
jgi:probable FeS assembly SUF system protein SufT